ncbi:hypothetical protein PSHT_01498 [Puccinia striiformis]|uniref:Proteasome alpha-type subunits domain-containing protein n=2 Tax=Puccinia striiformis TaxID=27350 RepID=A0A2S4WKB3_9BASI|nr:hypothetical protein PSHT_01498 [Puccinia striiformis]
MFQIEHALAAVGQGTSSLGIKASNGVVIATEKKTASILVDDSIIEKVASICPNIGMVYSGMGPDYRVLVTRARKIAQAYWKVYGEYPPTRLLTQEIATVMQEATQSGSIDETEMFSIKSSGVRPFGVSLLIAGWDEHRGSTLYQVDPSGSFWPWKASAIGKNMVNAKTFLEKRYNEELSLEDAIHTAILTLKEGFEGQMTEKTIEIGVMGTVGVGADTIQPADRSSPVFRKLTEAEIVIKGTARRPRLPRSEAGYTRGLTDGKQSGKQPAASKTATASKNAMSTSTDSSSTSNPEPSQDRIVIPLATDERCWFKCRQSNAGRLRGQEPLCSLFCYYSNQLPSLITDPTNALQKSQGSTRTTDSNVPNKADDNTKEEPEDRWDELIRKYTFTFLEGKYLYFATGKPAITRHLASMRQLGAVEHDWLVQKFKEHQLEEEKLNLNTAINSSNRSQINSSKVVKHSDPDKSHRGLVVLAYHKDYESVINIAHTIASGFANIESHFRKIYGPSYKIVQKIPTSIDQLITRSSSSSSNESRNHDNEIPSQFKLIHNLFNKPLLSNSMILLNRSFESLTEVCTRLKARYSSRFETNNNNNNNRNGKSGSPPHPPVSPPSS